MDSGWAIFGVACYGFIVLVYLILPFRFLKVFTRIADETQKMNERQERQERLQQLATQQRGY